jgi:predicted lactoylglutathione lyase
MLSFIVQNPKQVDEWYARLKALGAEIRTQPKWEEPKNGRRLYGLSFKDPEGYVLEVFSWVD